MTGRARFALLLLVAGQLAGCASLPASVPVPPYVGADCLTTGGHLVRVTGAMSGGWWWVKGETYAPWMAPTSELATCR